MSLKGKEALHMYQIGIDIGGTNVKIGLLAEALELTRSAFAWMAEFEGEIPGASAVECGNYLMMDPIAARAEAAAMLPVLEALDAEKLHY